MPTETKSEYTTYLNGTPFPEITLLPDVPGSEVWPIPEPITLTLHVNPPKHWRCKSRKRFVKMVMGEGWPRNAAESLARFCAAFEIPYSRAWKEHLLAGTRW